VAHGAHRSRTDATRTDATRADSTRAEMTFADMTGPGTIGAGTTGVRGRHRAHEVTCRRTAIIRCPTVTAPAMVR
jgi:hypothetical protein